MRHGNCSTADGGASCIEDGGLSELTLDGQYNSAGGVRVSTCMGCSLGPLLYVIHFTERGIWVDGGHEVMVHRSWVGEHLYVRAASVMHLHLHFRERHCPQGDRKPGWPAWANKSAGVHGSCTEWGNVTGCRVPRSLAGIHIVRPQTLVGSRQFFLF